MGSLKNNSQGGVIKIHLKSIAIITILLLGITACRNSKNNLKFKQKSFTKASQGCSTDGKPCATIIINYPTFTQASHPDIAKKLNAIVNKISLQDLTETKTTNLDAMAEIFFEEFAKFKEELPKNPQNWEIERNITANLVSPQVLTLQMDEYSFLGGAHPNTFVKFLNLNPQKGKIIQLSELLKPGYESKLPTIAEIAFRKAQELDADENLGSTVYSFKDGKFKLNDNFLITKEGLKFLFNPYEIAPYMMGQIEFTIPHSSLKNLIPNKGPLESLVVKK